METRLPIDAAQEKGRDHATLLFGALLVAAAWLLARPYIGLRHDGYLYMAQVLLRWYPDIFQRDLFFLFGSQDKYSLVAPVLATLYRYVDVGVAQIVMVTLCQLSMVVAALAWLRRAGATFDECVLALVALGVMSHNYGGWAIFSFSERFITGRTLAEPLALLALFLVERKRLAAGFVALLASALFHPLVAVPIAVVIWVLLVLRDRRWAWALLGLPAVLALALAGVDPFQRLVMAYDPEWWKSVRHASGHILVLDWQVSEIATVVFDCGVVWLAARTFTPLSTLLKAVVIATVVLVPLSALMVDGLHNVLLTQLQLWRIHWIIRFFSIVFLPLLLLRAWRRDDPLSQLFVLAAAAAAVSVNIRYFSATALTAWAALSLWLYKARPAIDPRLVRVGRMVTALVLVTVSGLVVHLAAKQLEFHRGLLADPSAFVLLAVTAPLLSLPAAYLLQRSWHRGGGAAAAAMLLCAGGAAFGALHWDQRSETTKYLETHLREPHPWEKIIAPHDQVLWWDQAERVWGLLHRASYYSILQGAGILFNRGTAMEHLHRAKVTGPIQLQKDVCLMMSDLGAGGVQADCWPTVEAIEEACRNDELLRYVILDRKLPRGAVAQWSAQPNGTTFHLHDCKQIR